MFEQEMASVFNLNSIFLSVNHYRMKEIMLFRQLDFVEGRGHQVKNKTQGRTQGNLLQLLL